MKSMRTVLKATLAAAAVAGSATLLGPASPALAAVDPCVQRVVVFNNSGSILSYVLSNRTGVSTVPTDEYPVNQFRSTDLTTTAYTAGEDVRPVVTAQGGDTLPANQFVSFCDNGQTATYTVTGTLNDLSVTLIGG